MNNLPVWFERVEGGFLFFGATALFFAFHGHWWLYALLFFAFDLSMLGYLADPKVGAIVYNTVHSLPLPLVCVAIGLASFQIFWLASVALIWIAHIGLDRLLGFGLKYPDRFSHTLLDRH